MVELTQLVDYQNLYSTTPAKLKLINGVFGPEIPTPASVYDYQIGDTIGYHFSDDENITGLPNTFHEGEERYVIRSRTLDTGTNILTVRYDKYALDIWYHSYHYQYPDIAYNLGPDSGSWPFDLNEDFLTGTYDSTGYANFWHDVYPNGGYYNGILVMDTLDGDTVLLPTHYRFQVDISGPDVFRPGQGLVYSNTGSFTNFTRRRTCGPGHPCRGIPTSAKISLAGKLELVENPVTDQLRLASSTPLHLQLQNLQGRLVAQGTGISLATGHLPTGLYLLKATDPQGRQATLRVVKL